MGQLFIDGFEQFKGETEVQKALLRADYLLPTGANGVTPQGGRTPGAIGMQVSDALVGRRAAWTAGKFTVGFAAFAQARGLMVTLRATGRPIVMWLDPETGAPRLQDKEGGSIPWRKYWYYYEIELDRATQTASLFINGRAEIEGVPFPENSNITNMLMVEFGTKPVGVNDTWFTLPAIGSQCLYDDFYINDGPRLGPILITTRFPTATPLAEWEPSPEAPSNHGAVSQRPPTPLDISVSAGNMGQTDAYTSTNTLPNDNEIIATGMCVLARKSPQLDAALGVFIGDNVNAVRRETTVSLTGEWFTRYVTFLRNPADTKAGIEAAQFGIKVVGEAVLVNEIRGGVYEPNSSGTYDSGFRLRANRTFDAFQIGGAVLETGYWLKETIDPATVEVRATHLSGFPPHLGTFDTWLPCNQTNEWHGAIVNASTPEKFKESVMLLEFRTIGQSNVFHTAIATMTTGIPQG